MAPRPTPIELRRLMGNPSKRPIPNGVRPAPTPDVPEPPDDLRGWARKEWLRLAPEAHALGILTAQYARDSIKFLSEFGMVPAGRTKVAAARYVGEGEFAGLLA